MSVAAKIQHQHAPAIAHRKSVGGALVLLNAGRSPAAPERWQSNRRDGRSQRFDIRAADFAPIDTSPDGPHQRSRFVESP
jgi:hypothetical protein